MNILRWWLHSYTVGVASYRILKMLSSPSSLVNDTKRRVIDDQIQCCVYTDRDHTMRIRVWMTPGVVLIIKLFINGGVCYLQKGFPAAYQDHNLHVSKILIQTNLFYCRTETTGPLQCGGGANMIKKSSSNAIQHLIPLIPFPYPWQRQEWGEKSQPSGTM